VRTRPIVQVVANAVAVMTVLGIVFGAVTACGSPEPPPAAPGQPRGSSNVLGQATGGTLGAAGRAMAAFTALGGLGHARGAARTVRDLGTQYATEGRALLGQLKASAGGVLATEPTPEQQATLADLRARTGERFDQAWLRAAEQMHRQVRAAANAVLADENASAEAKAAAQEALTRLDPLRKRLERATARAGVRTPRAVDAGSGGQAAGDVTPTAFLLLGIGAALLGSARWWQRRAA
jgi:predicted outer membrane protein